MPVNRELNSEEESAIEELQARTKSSLTPTLCEDPTLFYRFLKARDFDVDKAEKMLMKHINWRKVNQVDTILEDMKPKEYFYKYAMPSEIGLDKDGDVILYSAAGKIETTEILKCDRVNNYKKYWIWFSEYVASLTKAYSQKTGKECSQMTMIIDSDKLTLSNATHKTTAEFLLTIAHILQDNYPERMKSMYMVNAPGYYVFVYSILKAVMSNAMIQKIQVFGQNGWKEKLLDVIDAKVLPAFLGGERTDPDGNPLCRSFINHSDKCPHEYYLTNKDRYFRDTTDVKRITIPHSAKKEIYLEIKEKGSIIKWEYLVKNKDIGFGISFQESAQSMKEEIIPLEKYSTVDGTEIGSYKCRSAGKYIIIFDNSHSWISSKEIEYHLMVLQPE